MGWAKHCAQSLYRGEDYLLAVDSHSRFEKDWDSTLIELLEQCPSSKSIISSSPHSYRLNEDRLIDEVATFRYPSRFTDNALLKLVSRRFDRLPNAPLHAPFLCPRFMFAKAQFIQELPADPFIYFSEEEIILSIRAWCAGWDVYHPPRVPVWHLYNSDGKLRPVHWKENADWRKYQQRSLDCYKYYVGDADREGLDHNFSGERSAYKLQSIRQLSDFQDFAGVDLEGQQILIGNKPSAIEGAIEGAIEQETEISASDVLWPKTGSKQALNPIEPLELGDRVPYFSLLDVNGKTCHSEIYAGQTLLLHVVCTPNSEMAPDARKTLDFVEELAACDEQVMAWRKLGKFDRLCIYPGVEVIDFWQHFIQMKFAVELPNSSIWIKTCITNIFITP